MLSCPTCLHQFPVQAEQEGQKIRCPSCGQKMLVPARPATSNPTLLAVNVPEPAQVQAPAPPQLLTPPATMATPMAPIEMGRCYFCGRRFALNALTRRHSTTGSSEGGGWSPAGSFSTSQTHYGIVDCCRDCSAEQTRQEESAETRRLVGWVVLIVGGLIAAVTVLAITMRP